MSHLIFTSDFQELVRGTLKAGTPCRINFNPKRFIGPKENYLHGETGTEITAHTIFLPAGIQASTHLVSETGILPNAVEALNGTGSMLSGYINIPKDATEIEIWFTLKDREGNIYYDSENGFNYHFRFSSSDILSADVSVVNETNKPLAVLNATFISTPEVDSFQIRYRLLNFPGETGEKELLLNLTDNTGNKTWSIHDQAVPVDSVIAYDYSYNIGGKKFKNDNNGNYFISAAAKLKT